MEPTALRAGDSWQWKRSYGNYPSGAGWALQYILNSPLAKFPFPAGTITADEDGQAFDIAVAPAQTAACPAGNYELYAVLTLTVGGTVTAQETRLLQSVRVDPNILAGNSPIDTRSFIKKTLDALEAAIAGDQSPLVQEYEIGGQGGNRRIKYMDRKQLTDLRDVYAYRYDQERAARGEFTPKHKVEITFRQAF